MIEINNASGTVTRTSKQSDTQQPHYFNSFQNYSSNSKGQSTTTSSTSDKEFLPIPEKYKQKSDEILNFINRSLNEGLSGLSVLSSILPHEFFDPNNVNDFQKYLIDRTMFKMMSETQVINWVPSLKKIYPIRTSGNGNCLLHAVLIAMVGIHDSNLLLRDKLIHFMNKNKTALKANWKIERLKTDKLYGIQSEDAKLDSVCLYLDYNKSLF